MGTTADDRKSGTAGMYGTIVDVVDANSFWVLQVQFAKGVAETTVEHRPMANIVAGEGVSSPKELIGRRVWVSRDGDNIAFVDGE